MERMKIAKKNFSLTPKHIFLFYFAFFYSYILIYHNFFVKRISEWGVEITTYTHHLVDYSFGFCTKFFAGALYHLFFKEVEVNQLNIYLKTIVFLFFAFLSYMLARAIMLRKDRGDRKTLLIIFIFYLSGPCTFAIFTYQLGMLDLYWLLFGGIFFFIVNKKYLKYIVPLTFAGTLLVHFSSMAAYIILFALVLLYEAAANESKKLRKEYLFVFIISVI